MGRETKVGLLAGLTFIVCFAVILANRGRDSTVDASLPRVGFIHQPLPGPASPPAGAARRPAQHGPDQTGTGHRVAGASAPDRSERPSRRAAAPPADTRPALPAGIRGEPAGINSPVPPHPIEAGTTGPVVLVSTDEPTPQERRDEQSRQLQERLNALTAQTGAEAGTATPGTPPADSRRDDLPSGATSRVPPPRAGHRAADGSRSESPTPVAPLEQYTVQPGDSLSKVAARFYGRATNRAINAIYDANRSKLASPDAVRVGDELVIPALDGITPRAASGGEAPATTRRTPASRTPAGAVVNPAARESDGPTSFDWYQIRKNDRYVTIAREQLGDERRWRELFELNKDRFPDPQRIKEGVRIRIPKNGNRPGNGR